MQLELERNQVIDRDNLTLLHKMQHIMKTEGVVDHRNDYKHHRYIYFQTTVHKLSIFYSLNDLKRQREVERVQHENEVSSTVHYIMYNALSQCLRDYKRSNRYIESVIVLSRGERMHT